MVEDGEDEVEADPDPEFKAPPPAVGVLRPNFPMRFIPFDMRLVRPSFSSRPLNIPASEWGWGSAEDLEDDLDFKKKCERIKINF